MPDYADDTSTAYDEADRPRFDDSPPPLPADRPQAVDDYGVTAAEASAGEPLDDRLARERPDQVRPDTEKDLVATDQGEAGGGLSAEEAAMHEVPEDELADETPDQE